MRSLSTLLIVLLTLLGIAPAGEAQPTARVQLEGTIQAVDCNAQQLTLQSGSGTTVVQSTLATVIRVDGESTPLCSLEPYIGAPVTVSLVPVGGQFMIAQLTVHSAPAAPPPVPYAGAPAPPPVPYTPVPQMSSPAPTIAGAVLGTIMVGGLVYLLVRGANGAFYRYPYYGQYRPIYYQPSYRPYVGPLRPTLTYGPYRRCRDRTWSQWCY